MDVWNRQVDDLGVSTITPVCGFLHASLIDVNNVYAAAAPNDPVLRVPIFGENPTDPWFGATRIETNGEGHQAISDHSGYFTTGSESLENLAAITEGRTSNVSTVKPSLANWAGDATSMPTVVSNQVIDGLRDHLPPGRNCSMTRSTSTKEP